MAVVRRHAVPGRARELAELTRVDYADSFAVDLATQRPPIEWVRMCVEQMPALFHTIKIAHRSLGLEVSSGDDADHVFGWEIVRSEATEGVLANHGLLGQPRIIGLAEPGRFVLSTLIEFNGLIGRSLWAAAAPIHRAVAKRILANLPELRAVA